MNYMKLIIAGVVSFAIMFGFGVLWHLLIFADYLQSQFIGIGRLDFLIPIIMGGEFIRSFLMAFIYPFGFKGGSPVKEGAIFGLLMGLFTVPMNLITFGQFRFMNSQWLFVEGAFFIIQGIIGGIAIALIYGNATKKSV